MYDISCLFDAFENYDDIYQSYMKTVSSEIPYRGTDITATDALWDTIEAAACIASRGQYGEDYPLFLSGIKKISNHIFEESFSAELAILRACKVMYAAACVLKNIEIKRVTDVEAYHAISISKSKYKKLSKIRNFEPLGFAYVVEAIKILEEDVLDK